MKYVIVYWSRFGNGKKIIDNLVTKLNKKRANSQCFKTDELDPTKMPAADLYIFSAPTEAFNVQKNMRNFMKKLEDMDGKKYGIINTHGQKKNRLYKMESLLSKKQMVMVAGLEFRVGDDFKTGNGLPSGWEAKLDQFVGKIF